MQPGAIPTIWASLRRMPRMRDFCFYANLSSGNRTWLTLHYTACEASRSAWIFGHVSTRGTNMADGLIFMADGLIFAMACVGPPLRLRVGR
jgi:hypothetical protein